MKADTAEGAQRQPQSLIEIARAALDAHSQFHGRVDRFDFDQTDGAIVIKGTVPSFYLKQVIQTILGGLEGVQRVINCVDVVCGQGLSDCSQATRERCALERPWLQKNPGCFRTCLGDSENAERA